MPEGLSAAEVHALHDTQISRYGGSPGLRDSGLLESALAQPTQELFGQMRFPTVPSQAAAYLYHLARAHAFMDGNKRTALYAALIWLDLHNLHLAATQDELYKLTLEVAQGQLTLEETAQFFEAHAVDRSE
jgi:death-on-curing protein